VEELRSWFTSDMPYLAMVRQLIARRYPALEQLLMPPASPGPTSDLTTGASLGATHCRREHIVAGGARAAMRIA